MNADDPRMRFRVWVRGTLIDEIWVDVAAGTTEDAMVCGDVLSLRHLAITQAADAAGQPWLIEIYDPAKPETEAYVRFGTDAVRMVEPQVVDDIEESLRGRY